MEQREQKNVLYTEKIDLSDQLLKELRGEEEDVTNDSIAINIQNANELMEKLGIEKTVKG